MASYKVVMKEMRGTDHVEFTVTADDMRLEVCSCDGDDQTCDHSTDYFNLFNNDDDDDANEIAVAAIPFKEVFYITS
jgi:hypothetical protein